jgi:hypothetical protein
MTSRARRGRGYQGFCDNSTKALLLKSATMGEGGIKNYQKLHDVIYGRPQTTHLNQGIAVIWKRVQCFEIQDLEPGTSL